MLKVPVHARCNVPIIVLKKPVSRTRAFKNQIGHSIDNRNEREYKNENENCVRVNDITSWNNALDSYTEQIICIPPYVIQQHSPEHFMSNSDDSTEDLISVKITFSVKK